MSKEIQNKLAIIVGVIFLMMGVVSLTLHLMGRSLQDEVRAILFSILGFILVFGTLYKKKGNK